MANGNENKFLGQTRWDHGERQVHRAESKSVFGVGFGFWNTTVSVSVTNSSSQLGQLHASNFSNVGPGLHTPRNVAPYQLLPTLHMGTGHFADTA
jgi:hypothetical protein